MASDDEVAIQRILRHYNELPFRAFREATPVQILTAFHHLILRLHADLGFNFSTVNARTHQRFVKSMAVLGLESCAPSLTSITRLDKPVLIYAFNAVIDLIESRYVRSLPNDNGYPAVSVQSRPDLNTTLPRPRSKRMSMVAATSLPPAAGMPKARTKRMSMVATSSLRPGLASPSVHSTTRRSLTLGLTLTPRRKSNSNLLADPECSKSVLPAPSSTVVPSSKFSTPLRSVRENERVSAVSKEPASIVRSSQIVVTPRAIKARLSLLPINTPPSKIPSLRQTRKPRPSVVPVITPAELPEGFEKMENPFKTKAKLKSTPVASRPPSHQGEKLKIIPLELSRSDTEAFETKPKIARTPESHPQSANNGSTRSLSDIPASDSRVGSVCSEEPGKLASLYKRFLITDNDDNLPLRTIRKLIKAQRATKESIKSDEIEADDSTRKNSSKAAFSVPSPTRENDSDYSDKENQQGKKARLKKKKPVAEKAQEKETGNHVNESRATRRGKKQALPVTDDVEDELIREASALLERCELSDDEKSRKRAVNSRKLMEAIVTIRKSVAPRRRRNAK